ncbi:MBL fold metallo-hydrolase [bacterium]|nr:MBL fold metallo-hydrolase [bacterium]
MPTFLKSFVFSPFQENTYVIYDDKKQCAIVDPGCYEQHEKEELRAWIEEKQLKPVLLLNTHSHLDHTFGNAYVSRIWNLTPQVHKLDRPVYERFSDMASAYGLRAAETPPDPNYTLEEGKSIEFGNTKLDVHFMPGHCPGHVVFECVEENWILGGDVLFRGSIGRTDLLGGDMNTLMDSIKNKLLLLDENRVVYSGHGPETTLKEEKASNPFLQ